uniref:Histidine--tRNA ligase, chloroplastic n=1 Tax=Neoizziella asiatica TaxID=1077397 RepID=A0A1G4NX86_9FLOR|nr:Histidine-tRNA ligase [Neoizziella asiatica]SCW23280.1 Histidine-tRNA ligase [Neoizziella asiatica]
MQSIRGMHDILPEEIKYWQYIYSQAFRILDTANYKEIRTPIVELQSLFERSIGQETDIIDKEMYNFTDRGDRNLTLRPEGTAGIARAIIQHKLCKNNSIAKLWYLGPMFRYERPQKGRQRQFHQLGLEYYGNNHPMVDAEVIFLAHQILNSLQCGPINLEINSIGNSEERYIYTTALQEYLIKYMEDLKEEEKHKILNNPIRLLDSKNTQVQSILEYAPQLNSYLKTASQDHFYKVQEYLDAMEIRYQLKNNLVRGLDYYNNTVFELKTTLLGAQDTICGGGRYDYLTHKLSGQQLNAIGWGIGIERLLLLIQKNLKVSDKKICMYLASSVLDHVEYTSKIMILLQKYALKYELDLSGCSIKKHLQKARKKEAMLCVIIGPEEIKHNTVSIKWMYKKLQYTYSFKKFQELLPNIQKEYEDILQKEMIPDNPQCEVDIFSKSSDN